MGAHLICRFPIVTCCVGLVLASVGWVAAQEPAAKESAFTFYAVYKPLADARTLKTGITRSTMSGDGTQLYFTTYDEAKRRPGLYSIDADGSKLTPLPLPTEFGFVESVATSRDGKRVFLADRRHICKVEGGKAVVLMDSKKYKEVVDVTLEPIRCTADGEYAYFQGGVGVLDIWRVRQSGGAPQKVVDVASVKRDGGTPYCARRFAVSADGGTVAFTISGYFPKGGAWVDKNEVFVSTAGVTRQLTNDAESILKERLALSGDGKTVVYSAGGPGAKDATWYAMPAAGGQRRGVETVGFNIGGVVLNADGSRLLLAWDGGRLIRTDGRGGDKLLPAWNVTNIAVSADFNPAISEDGRRVSFCQGGEVLYIGHIGDPKAVPDAPAIKGVTFDRPYLPADDPDVAVRIQAEISDPQGVADVTHTAVDSLVDGHTVRFADLPAHFPLGINDRGLDPDKKAGDGVYTGFGRPGPRIQDHKEMTVRVSARDKSGLVTVADVRLRLDGLPREPGEVVKDPLFGAPVVKDELIVTPFRGVKEADLAKAFDELSLPTKIVDRIRRFDLYLVKVPPDKLHEARHRLANHPLVGACGYNTIEYSHQPFNDPALGDPQDRGWGLHRIRAPEAWQLSTAGAVIGVVDSGALLTHEELLGKTFDPYSYQTNSPVFQTQGRVLRHGTHVAVTAAGHAGNGRGTAGVSPRSRVTLVQALHLHPGQATPSATAWELNDALNRAMRSRVRVVNASFGPGYSADPLVNGWRNANTPQQRATFEQQILARTRVWLQSYQSALDRARTDGVIICKSAGNDNVPARFDPLSSSRRVIAVAATDTGNARAGFSNYGPDATVSAPGVRIWSGIENGGYNYLDGTSMAAPHVTGVVALMKGLADNLTFEEVRDILVTTGRKLDTDQPIGPLVNARAAVEEVRRRMKGGPPAPKPEPPLIPQPPAPPLPPPAPPKDGKKILDDPAPWKNAEVQRLIDLYLATAIPAGVDPKEGWFFDKYGRLINPKTMKWDMPPDYAARRYEIIWGIAKRFDSTNLGTLYDFVVKNLTGM